MRQLRLFHETDTLGVGAVLVAYLNWASYQLSQNLRGEQEVHFAIAVALTLGLAYRFARQSLSPLHHEIASRVILLLSGMLAFSGWATESVALVAGANLWFLLEGARFSEKDLYAYQKLTPLLYLLLVFLPPGNRHEYFLLQKIIGLYLMLPFLGKTQEGVHGNRNPYEQVVLVALAVVVVLFLPAASLTLLISPRSATPEMQLVERMFAGIGLCVLLVVAGLVVREHRRGSRRSRWHNAGLR